MSKPTSNPDVRIEVPHKDLGEDTFHDWIFLGAWRGEPVYVNRDSIGRKGATTARWLWLWCNNANCPGRALYRVIAVENAVNEAVAR